jgi:hypothetical protein
LLSQNHFAEPEWHVLIFLHPILLCKITYWVTAVDALTD